MEIKSLENTSLKEIVETLNLAFSDYVIPLKFTEDYAKERWTASGVDYSLSFGAFDGDKLVGFIIHAINNYEGNTFAYNASTGVIPEYRRKGVLSKLYNVGLKELKKANITNSVLEVITSNERAINAYKKVGFTIDKHFKLYNFIITEEQKSDSDFVIITKPLEDFNLYESLRNYSPSLENQNHCLETYKDQLVVIEVLDNDELVAYAIHHKTTNRIHSLGVKDNLWFRYGMAIFNGLERGKYNIINVNVQNKEMHEFFKMMFFENYIDQYEMCLSL